MIEIQKQSELEAVKKQGLLDDSYMRAIEGYFHQLVDACDRPTGVEPCLDSGSFRILDPEVDDWRALILADEVMLFEWCERVDVGDGGYVYKICCQEDND